MRAPGRVSRAAHEVHSLLPPVLLTTVGKGPSARPGPQVNRPISCKAPSSDLLSLGNIKSLRMCNAKVYILSRPYCLKWHRTLPPNLKAFTSLLYHFHCPCCSHALVSIALPGSHTNVHTPCHRAATISRYQRHIRSQGRLVKGSHTRSRCCSSCYHSVHYRSCNRYTAQIYSKYLQL
jgi:hypothetical protein